MPTRRSGAWVGCRPSDPPSPDSHLADTLRNHISDLTIENIFDTVRYPVLDASVGWQCSCTVRGHSDTTGAICGVETITVGLTWKRLRSPVIVIGFADAAARGGLGTRRPHGGLIGTDRPPEGARALGLGSWCPGARRLTEGRGVGCRVPFGCQPVQVRLVGVPCFGLVGEERVGLVEDERVGAPCRRVAWLTGSSAASMREWTCCRRFSASGHSRVRRSGSERNARKVSHRSQPQPQPPADSVIDQSVDVRRGRASRARSRAAQSAARSPKPASAGRPSPGRPVAARSAGISSAVTASGCCRRYAATVVRVLAVPVAAAAVSTDASGLPRLSRPLSR